MTPVTLLVVDDEADLEYVIRQKFKASIQAGEFSVVFAPHGEAALQQLARHPNIEVVLSDIRMPVMDGLTLLEHLRADYARVCPVMMSAYGDRSNLVAAMDAGAYDFLRKPVDLNDLEFVILKAVRYVRERARREHELRIAARQRDLFADKCGDGLAVIQEDRIVFVNQVFCQLLGATAEQVLGQSQTTIFTDLSQPLSNGQSPESIP